MRKFNRIYALLFVIAVFAACTNDHDRPKKTGGPYYYKYLGYTPIGLTPCNPVDKDEITPEEAKKYDSYGIAYYDEQGRIVSCTRYLHGKRDWGFRFYYNIAGYLERKEDLNPDGSIRRVFYYDKDENIIKTENR